jgi:hypothetical protein
MDPDPGGSKTYGSGFGSATLAPGCFMYVRSHMFAPLLSIQLCSKKFVPHCFHARLSQLFALHCTSLDHLRLFPCIVFLCYIFSSPGSFLYVLSLHMGHLQVFDVCSQCPASPESRRPRCGWVSSPAPYSAGPVVSDLLFRSKRPRAGNAP